MQAQAEFKAWIEGFRGRYAALLAASARGGSWSSRLATGLDHGGVGDLDRQTLPGDARGPGRPQGRSSGSRAHWPQLETVATVLGGGIDGADRQRDGDRRGLGGGRRLRFLSRGSRRHGTAALPAGVRVDLRAPVPARVTRWSARGRRAMLATPHEFLGGIRSSDGPRAAGDWLATTRIWRCWPRGRAVMRERATALVRHYGAARSRRFFAEKVRRLRGRRPRCSRRGRR